MTLFKSGETCTQTSKYIEVDQNGSIHYVNDKTHIVSLQKVEQFPPTRTSGLCWKEF